MLDTAPVTGEIRAEIRFANDQSLANAAILGASLVGARVLARDTRALIEINRIEGLTFQQAVLESNKLERNTESFTTTYGSTIPDTMTGGVGEVKAGKYITDSRQLRA